MTRFTRSLTLSAFGLFIALCLTQQHSLTAGATHRPNVLFIAVDDLNDRKYPAVVHLRDNHAVRPQHWHFIRYADGSEELYNAVEDPHQWNNLANDERHADAKANLRKWLPQTNAPQSPDKPR